MDEPLRLPTHADPPRGANPIIAVDIARRDGMPPGR